ncbi:MAG: hypothetical protein IK117_09940 [Bacteroidales bacterium]|jgi:hypothetical protein|nr:hypothetical protein [Bacteroidales bacterium]
MDNQKFNQVFKVGYIALLVVALLATVWYWAVASGKDCLACSLSVCEGIGPNGESYMLPADSCALSYDEILEKERVQGVDVSECSQECINYADAYLVFAFLLIILAVGSMVVMLFYSAFTSGKKLSKTTLITLVFVVVVALLGFLLSSDTIPEILGFDGTITLFDVKLTDTLLYATYILLGGAVVAILSSFVIKFLRK